MNKYYLLFLLFFGCRDADFFVAAQSSGQMVVRKISAICLPDVNPANIVDGCGRDPRNYQPMSLLYVYGNEMPAAHRLQGEAAAALVQPIEGKIIVVAEGMSNALRVFDALKNLLVASTLDNPSVRFQNKSQGGIDLQEWVASGVGVIDARVQVVLLHHSLSNNFSACDSQSYVDTTRYFLKQRLLQLKLKYPNCKQVFLQSREFGGWKCYSTPGAPAEPAAHKNGYGVKAVVDLQVSGSDFDLSYLNAPFIAWSFNPWDPMSPRSWFEGAGLHPCSTGANLEAQQWFDFLLNDSTTRPWFAANP